MARQQNALFTLFDMQFKKFSASPCNFLMGTTCVPETFDIRLINAYFSCHEGARSLNKVLSFSIEAFVVSSMLHIRHELITIKFLFPFLYDIISR